MNYLYKTSNTHNVTTRFEISKQINLSKPRKYDFEYEEKDRVNFVNHSSFLHKLVVISRILQLNTKYLKYKVTFVI